MLAIFNSAKLADATDVAERADNEITNADPPTATAVAQSEASFCSGASPNKQAAPDVAPVEQPRPQPSSLQPGETEVGDNGAEIRFAKEFSKYAIYDSAGHLNGYRRSLEAAREFASSLPTASLKRHAGRDQPPTDYAEPDGRPDQRAFGPRQPKVLRRP